ncbi:hypothetical protein [Streptomyces sp. NPDC006193]|uniref:hypothetical protein n=1 Tax=Streptomyces sp. NPDC006193 TaxID=3155717 RepID=UPI0033A51927
MDQQEQTAAVNWQAIAEQREHERDQLHQVLHLLRYGMARAGSAELAASYVVQLIDTTMEMATGSALEPCDADARAARANEAEAQRDSAYRERAHLVALLTALTDGAVITDARDVDEPGWQIVYLTLGGRQCSWHISPRDTDLFQHVERVGALDVRALWDGHTTEEKYAHIAAWTAELAQRCGPACAEQHTERGRCEIARNR